jgi:pimeloyl-ACP methyl ester carboxylesterase
VSALAGCGGAHRALPAGPPLSSVCGAPPAGLHATTAWLRTSDGVRLFSAWAGHGDTTLLLAHESPGGMCGWLPAMRTFAAHGYRVVAFDFRGFAPSDSPDRGYLDYARDLQAAVDTAHAKKTVLIGASFGGAAAVADGPALHGVDGIVSLSGEQDLPRPRLDAIGNAPRLRTPLLVVAARQDSYLDGPSARALVKAAGSASKQVAVFPGTYHGWDLLYAAPYRARVWSLVLRWIAAP